jgi:chromosome segregation protein
VILPDEEALWALIARNERDRPLMAIAAAASDPNPNGAKRPAGEPDIVPDGAIGWARNLVSLAAKIEPLAPLLLGDVLLAGSRSEAYRLAKELPAGALVVAPDGFMVHAGGLVEYQPPDPQHSILTQEEAWREAGAARDAQQSVLKALQVELQRLQEIIKQQQQLVDGKKEEERRLGRQLAGAASQLQAAQRNLDRANQQRQYLQAQEETNRKERERLLARIKETEALLQQKNAEVTHLSENLRNAQEHLEKLPVTEARQQRQELREKVESARTILAGRSAVVQSRQMTLQQIEGQLRRQEARRAELESQSSGDELAAGEGRMARLQMELGRLDSALAPLRARLQENETSLVRLETALSAEQREAHEQETIYMQSKIALSQQENYLEGLADRIRADLGLVTLPFDEEHLGQAPLPLADIVEDLPLVTELPDGAEESVQRYRGQLQRMGVVNMDAPREYEETLERSEFLTKQVTDLNRTENQLRAVIADLDSLTSEAFAVTVETVNDVFSAMFGRLFGGGSARLALTEPDDLTVSGVDIFARLPQRRQQSLALLSGGERALTAAALIFSLLKVNPPPFCVMDETDAMLDEVNITRFREVLCELADATQVIVITHNRGTVQAARTVYGISMAGDSTSQVISIRPEDYLNHHHK